MSQNQLFSDHTSQLNTHQKLTYEHESAADRPTTDGTGLIHNETHIIGNQMGIQQPINGDYGNQINQHHPHHEEIKVNQTPMGYGMHNQVKSEEIKYHSNQDSSLNIGDDGSRSKVGLVTANTYQAAILNKNLPRGYRIELEENVWKAVIQRQNQAQAQVKKNAQKKKKVGSGYPIGKKQTSLQEGSSRGGSEMGDDLADNQNKSGQRISGRERKHVNYNSMAAGTGELSASMDYNEVSGLNQKPGQKKPQNLSPKSVKAKISTLIQGLKNHPSISLFLQPLDHAHPRFQELQQDYINLHKIEYNFIDGKYQTTFALGIDFRKMFQIGYKIHIDDPNKQAKIKQIEQYFDQIFQDLDNKQLPSADRLQQGFQPEPQAFPQPKNQQNLNKKINQMQQEINKIKEKSQQPKNARTQSQIASTIQVALAQNHSDKPMTPQEKVALKDLIGHLTPEQQRGIIDIIKDSISQNNNEVFEFELDQLPVRKCRELDAYVKSCIKINQKKQKRKEADAQRRQLQKAQVNSRMQQQSQIAGMPPQQQQIQQPQQYQNQMMGVPGQPMMTQQQMPMQQYMHGQPQQMPIQQQPHQMAQAQVMNQMPHQVMGQPMIQQLPGQPGYRAMGVQQQPAPVNQNFSYGRRENFNQESDSDSDSDDSESDDDNQKKPAPGAPGAAGNKSNNINDMWRKQTQGPNIQ